MEKTNQIGVVWEFLGERICTLVKKKKNHGMEVQDAKWSGTNMNGYGILWWVRKKDKDSSPHMTLMFTVEHCRMNCAFHLRAKPMVEQIKLSWSSGWSTERKKKTLSWQIYLVLRQQVSYKIY